MIEIAKDFGLGVGLMLAIACPFVIPVAAGWCTGDQAILTGIGIILTILGVFILGFLGFIIREEVLGGRG